MEECPAIAIIKVVSLVVSTGGTDEGLATAATAGSTAGVPTTSAATSPQQ